MEQPQATRSRSNTSKSSVPPRPGSQGSTTSLQSVEVGAGFQPRAEQQVSGQPAPVYTQTRPQHHQRHYSHHPDDALYQQLHPQQSVEHPAIPTHDLRPMSQHGYHDLHSYPLHYHNGMPQYSIHQAGMPPQHLQHMRHDSEQYMEGSPAPDDSNNEGARRKKGTASSLANDQELRRLLTQYQGKTLKEIAAEVQKNEGSGGKSEKAKQVFAMLWLQESCRRSNNSVRRDRVFSRYTERCGNERVPTLNPASFGKLVRIIFPNVQTRRLGVRGESKYHYVDLSLFPEDGESIQLSQQPSQAVEEWHRMERQHRPSSDAANRIFASHTRTASMPQTNRPSMDTADFPPPSSQFLPRSTQSVSDVVASAADKDSPNIDCQYLNTPIIRIPQHGMSSSLVAALPSMRSRLPASLPTYLAMPKKDSQVLAAPNSQETPFDLPDIHSFLSGSTYDTSIADSLSHLYRSYCIDVIDAFRKCKEKPLFNHHSAFNGKMTVPVAKLFSLESLAPWIQESDMRMYKQMIRVVAPLALQEVPPQVWAVFDRVSSRLVSHLVTAFEEKCPLHVLVAKIVPAARFANVLKKLKGANTAAMHVAGMLHDEKFRTQMWVDLLSIVDPDQVVDESLPPPESLSTVEGMLSMDIKILVNPLNDPLVEAAEHDPSSRLATFLLQHIESTGILSSDPDESPSPLDHWVQWLESLSEPFEAHHPQCMINWHVRFWKSIMTQLGIGGAQSYQAWWYLEAFLTSMLDCMTQVEGMLMDEPNQRTVDQQEWRKRRQLEARREPHKDMPAGEPDSDDELGRKRKRDEKDMDNESRSPKRTVSGSTVKSEGSIVEHQHQQAHQPAERSEGSAEQQSHQSSGATGNNAATPSSNGINLDGTFSHAHPATSRNPDSQVDSDDDDDEEMATIRRAGPLDLPSINLTSSPLKRLLAVQTPIRLTPGRFLSKDVLGLHDDSGIDLGTEFERDGDEGKEGSPTKLGKKEGGRDAERDGYGEREREQDETMRKVRRELGLWSDPAEGEVIVV